MKVIDLFTKQEIKNVQEKDHELLCDKMKLLENELRARGFEEAAKAVHTAINKVSSTVLREAVAAYKKELSEEKSKEVVNV
jgi:hypothetical protein